MKRNIYLRVALLLLFGVWVSSTMISGTLAKYAASGLGTASARFAAFSFVVDTKTCAGLGGTQEIVTIPGIGATTSQSFTLPLFDTDYYGRTPNNGIKTVISNDGNPVVAPGINGISDYWYNPGSPGTAGTIWSAFYEENKPANNSANFNTASDYRKKVVFENKSEVTVRYKLEFDLNSLASITDGNGVMVGVWNLGVWTSGGTLLSHSRFHRSSDNPAAAGTLSRSDYPAQYSTPGLLRDWTTLGPNASETLLMELSWEFTQNIFPNTASTATNSWDRPDTALGLAAANGAIWFDPKFILTVEQVD